MSGVNSVNGVSGHPPAAEAYLRAATWPLPRAARQEARAELLAHLWQLRLDAEVVEPATGARPRMTKRITPSLSTASKPKCRASTVIEVREASSALMT